MATTEGNPAAPALAAGSAFEGLALVIGEVFPRWRVWADSTGWHAMRRGSYRQLDDAGDGVHSLHSADPVVLVLLLEEQDRIPPPDGWDIPEPAMPPTPLEAALAPGPTDRARDEIADTIAARNPGWTIGHDLFGWNAVRASDGKELRAASSPALEALISVTSQGAS
jgi:hypothetical protein